MDGSAVPCAAARQCIERGRTWRGVGRHRRCHRWQRGEGGCDRRGHWRPVWRHSAAPTGRENGGSGATAVGRLCPATSELHTGLERLHVGSWVQRKMTNWKKGTAILRKELCIIFAGKFMFPLQGVAADFDGSKPLACAIVEAIECVPGEGCIKGWAEDLNLPRFLTVDFGKS